MSDEELNKKFLKEPWGAFLDQIGMRPVDTESSAREVARCAAERIINLRKEIDKLNKEKESFLPKHQIKYSEEEMEAASKWPMTLLPSTPTKKIIQISTVVDAIYGCRIFGLDNFGVLYELQGNQWQPLANKINDNSETD